MKQILAIVICLMAGSSVLAQSFRSDPAVIEYRNELQRLNQYEKNDSVAFHQLADSLMALNIDGLKASVMEQMGNYHYYRIHMKEATSYFQKAAALSRDNSPTNLAARLKQIFIAKEPSKLDSLEKEFKKLLLLAEEYEDGSNQAIAHNGLALIYEDRGDLELAEKHLFSGLKITNNPHLYYERGILLNNLGTMQLALGRFEEAGENFNECLELCHKIGETRLMLSANLNLGLILSAQGESDSAKTIHRKAIEDGGRFRDALLSMHGYSNLATVFEDEGNLDSAVWYITIALQIAQVNGIMDNRSLIWSQKARMEIPRDLEAAEADLDSAEHYMEYGSRFENGRFLYILRYNVALKRNDFEGALGHYINFRNYRDSLQSQENLAKLEILEGQYKFEQQQRLLEASEARADLLEKDKALAEKRMEANRQWILIIVSAVALLFLSVLIIWYLREKRREQQFSQRLIEHTEKDRMRISGELHDQIGGGLVMLKSAVLNEQADRHRIIEDLEHTVENVRRLSNEVYPPFIQAMTALEAVKRLLVDAKRSTDLVVSHDIDALQYVTDDVQKLHIYRITQELITNTIKHSGGSAIRLEVTKKGQLLEFRYMDNGVGLNPSSDLKSTGTMGLNNIQRRVSQLGGKLQVESTRHVKTLFEFTFKPLTEKQEA